jgi:hypothetical protein
VVEFLNFVVIDRCNSTTSRNGPLAFRSGPGLVAFEPRSKLQKCATTYDLVQDSARERAEAQEDGTD